MTYHDHRFFSDEGDYHDHITLRFVLAGCVAFWLVIAAFAWWLL